MSHLPGPPTGQEIAKGAQRSWIFIAGIFAFLGVLAWWSCGRGVYRHYRVTRSAVVRFHQRLDRADYQSIYEDTSPAFRGTGPQDADIKFFENVHEKMGDSGAMTATGFHLNWETGYFLVNQSFNTSFAQGQAQEEFVWLVGDDNHPLLQTYRIDAPQFH